MIYYALKLFSFITNQIKMSKIYENYFYSSFATCTTAICMQEEKSYVKNSIKKIIK